MHVSGCGDVPNVRHITRYLPVQVERLHDEAVQLKVLQSALTLLQSPLEIESEVRSLIAQTASAELGRGAQRDTGALMDEVG